MIQHSGTGAGQRESTDVNRLVRAHIDLALNGKRAQTPDFQVTVEQTLSEDTGEVELIPQEIGRVLINLLGNAFDAVHKHASAQDSAFVPRLNVSTNRTEAGVEIEVSDNGPGIPAQYQEKIFEPFFTTKPTGEGTGLGLSMSYDVITQGHGGTL
jgi:signal transduction histidine kinase